MYLRKLDAKRAQCSENRRTDNQEAYLRHQDITERKLFEEQLLKAGAVGALMPR